MMQKWLARLAMSILGTLALAAAVRATEPTTPPNGFFPIGVYGQEADAFATWKARGVNTVVNYSIPGAWQEYWNDSAVVDGLWMIRNPRTNLKDDIDQPYLLAWSQTDLPDVNNISTKTLAATYAQWKAADPNRQIVVDLSAATINSNDAAYTASADMVSSQIFPISVSNQPLWIDKATSTTLKNPGTAVDAMRSISGNKPQYAYIETSNQLGGSNHRGPSADEVRGETWDAIIHGARGIIYDPVSGSTADATPSDVAAGITLTDSLINEYSAPLASLSGSQTNTLDLPGGLEATWRDYDGQRLYFVLNFSHIAVSNAHFALSGLSALTLSVPDESRTLIVQNGAVTDSFGAYQIHIYETTAGAGVGSAVPEPGLALLGCGLLLLRASSGRRRS